MSFERPQPSQVADAAIQKSLTPQELREQIRLPREKWSAAFRQLIDEKTREYDRDSPELSPVEAAQADYERYLDGLGLTEADLRGKRVLDIGCGADAPFVQQLHQRGVTDEAYGLDMDIADDTLASLPGFVYRGDMQADFAVRDLDYAVSVGALNLQVWAGEEELDVKKVVGQTLASLKPSGELRVYPIDEAAAETPLPGAAASLEVWQRLMGEMSAKYGVECTLEPRGVAVLGNNHDILLRSVLVVRRKQSDSAAAEVAPK